MLNSTVAQGMTTVRHDWTMLPVGFAEIVGTATNTIRGSLCGLSLVLYGLFGTAVAVAAEPLPIESPESGQFVVDLAAVLSPAAQDRIQHLAERLSRERGAALTVVTVPSMRPYGVRGMGGLQSGAERLLAQWATVRAQVGGHGTGKQMLLLVSKASGEARIALGSGWDEAAQLRSQGIMAAALSPYFKQGALAAGIEAGALALARLARAPVAVARANGSGDGGGMVSADDGLSEWSWVQMLSSGAVGLLLALVVLRWWRQLGLLAALFFITAALVRLVSLPFNSASYAAYYDGAAGAGDPSSRDCSLGELFPNGDFAEDTGGLIESVMDFVGDFAGGFGG